MDHTREQLEEILAKRLATVPGYDEALALVRQNSEGEIWLVGGIVSRLLIAEVYKIPQEEFDLDFLVEKAREPPVVPEGWTMQRKKHGNPTFMKGSLEVDLFPIATHNFIKSNGLDPTIENFFRGVPFTIQAMVFDVTEQRLVGDIGIAALKAREYRVNNIEEARRMADAKGITVNDRILKKAKSLGLAPVLLEE